MATDNSLVATSSNHHNMIVGVLFGLGAALIWSGWSVATRFAVTTNLAAADITFLRCGVASLFLWPVLMKNGLGLKAIGLPRMAVMVVGAGAPFVLLAAIGMEYAPAAHVATLMIGAMPIFVAAIMGVLFKEKFSQIQLGGMLSVVTGVACIGGYALIMNRASGEWRGDLLFLLCGFLFASYTVAQRRSGISSWHAAALVNVVSAIVFTPFYFFYYSPKIFSVPLSDVLVQSLAQGIAVAILGLYCYGEAVRRLGAPRAAIFGALTPALAVLIAMSVLREFPGSITLAGIVLVMFGVALVVTGAKPKPA